MVPEIIFKYSGLYASAIFNNAFMYSREFVENVTKNSNDAIPIYTGFWKPHGNRILGTLSEITDIEWREKTIVAYVLDQCRGYSSPLTIRAGLNEKDFLYTMVHELTHRIFDQKEGSTDNYNKWLNERYPNVDRLVRNHIIVHAVDTALYLKLFTKEELEEQRRLDETKKFGEPYVKAWKIVDKEGYENIISTVNGRNAKN
ncbi:MAG: hypothetical protein M1125_01860 [Candidatus Marsarchaeota archaeon]|nr:hypothetical protein [Candidatus Marsarchaeota archaeon]